MIPRLRVTLQAEAALRAADACLGFKDRYETGARR
jgi:hypothetical protein